jgi:hypothetical protein
MEGMLWFDNDPHRSLAAKIKRAVAYYLKKYKQEATVCWVNEQQMDGKIAVQGIRLRAARNVLKNHLIIGVEKDPSTNGNQRP